MTPCQASSNKVHVLKEYIDMDISSSTNFICSAANSPPQNRDFEFQMCSIPDDKQQSITSPADELFYKGKLLPLHLPPRLEMVQKILQAGSNAALENNNSRVPFEESCPISSFRSSNNASNSYHSCNTSHSASCRFASELNRYGSGDYFFEWTNENNSDIHDKPKKSWFKKLKQSSLCQKLKASQTYLNSFFAKSACSNEPSAEAEATYNYVPGNLLDTREALRKSKKTEERASFSGKIDCGRMPKLASLMKNIEKEIYEDSASILNHRRSFSGITQRRHSASKCSASSSSCSSSSSSSISIGPHGIYDLQLLKKSSSGDSEIDMSIKEAITHCKQSRVA